MLVLVCWCNREPYSAQCLIPSAWQCGNIQDGWSVRESLRFLWLLNCRGVGGGGGGDGYGSGGGSDIGGVVVVVCAGCVYGIGAVFGNFGGGGGYSGLGW